MQTKSILLAAAAAIVGVAGQAAAQQTIYGNGASLPAPYIRQIFNCYGTDFPLVTRTGNPVAAGTPVNAFQYNPDVNLDGTPDGVIRNCALETSNVLSNFRGVYVSTGSGRGIQAILSRSPSFAGDYIVGDALTTLFPAGPHYGLSEAALGDNDVANYNLGTNSAVRPLTQSLSLLAPGAPVPTPLPGSTFPNPRERYGALVQFPLLIAPVNIAFDPVYRKYNHPTLGLQEYRLRIQNPRTALDSNGNTVTTGGIRLTPSAYCRIFHGQITNWNDAQLRSPAIVGNPSTFRDQNDVTQTNANFSAPIQIVGRLDSSGTTSIFTRHLAAICSSFVATNEYGTAGSTNLPTNLVSTATWTQSTQTLAGTETLGRFTRSNGNEGVADYVDFRALPTATLNDSGRGFTFNAGINAADVLTQARIGYLGPDYVLPGVLTTQTNTYGLTTVDLLNANGQNVAPTPTGARLAYELFPVVAGANRQNPARWVAPLERFVSYDINQDGAFDVADNPDTAAVNDPADRNPLANPRSATDPSFRAYPMLGTTNALLYTCYSSGGTRSAILRFFQEYLRQSNLNTNNLVNDTDQGLLDSAGLSPVPGGWQNAIRTVFFTTDTNAGVANAQAIQVTVNADGNGTFNNRFGQATPESTQCQGLVGAGA